MRLAADDVSFSPEDWMIELDAFIEETLKSVVRGIKRAQDDSELGRFVAPLLQGEKRNDFGNFHLKGDQSRQATVVQFDVQVGTETGSAIDGKGGAKARLVVVDIELGGARTSSVGATSTHRLQFNVPIEIPTFRSKDDHTEKSSPLTSRTSSEGHATGPFRPRESF